MTTASSLPLASHFPEYAHLTVKTGPVCMVSVERLVGNPDLCASSFNMGFVDQMRIFASTEKVGEVRRKQSMKLYNTPSPPVAILLPSGWTWTEKIESRFLVSFSPTSGQVQDVNEGIDAEI